MRLCLPTTIVFYLLASTSAQWRGHGRGSTCKSFNDCDGFLICNSSGKCGRIAKDISEDPSLPTDAIPGVSNQGAAGSLFLPTGANGLPLPTVTDGLPLSNGLPTSTVSGLIPTSTSVSAARTGIKVPGLATPEVVGGLDLNTKIAVGLGVGFTLLMLLFLALFYWRRKKAKDAEWNE